MKKFIYILLGITLPTTGTFALVDHYNHLPAGQYECPEKEEVCVINKHKTGELIFSEACKEDITSKMSKYAPMIKRNQCRVLPDPGRYHVCEYADAQCTVITLTTSTTISCTNNKKYVIPREQQHIINAKVMAAVAEGKCRDMFAENATPITESNTPAEEQTPTVESTAPETPAPIEPETVAPAQLELRKSTPVHTTVPVEEEIPEGNPGFIPAINYDVKINAPTKPIYQRKNLTPVITPDIPARVFTPIEPENVVNPTPEVTPEVPAAIEKKIEPLKRQELQDEIRTNVEAEQTPADDSDSVIKRILDKYRRL